MSYLGIFNQKCLIWAFLGRNLKITLLYLKSAPSNLPNCKIWWKKKMPKLVNKNALFGYFWARVLKNYGLIWISTLKIFQLQNVAKEQKCLICDQKCLIWFFWGIILKNYCHIWNQHPQICLIAKFCKNTRMLKFWSKNALFGCFGARVIKNYCHVWNQYPRICVIAKFC